MSDVPVTGAELEGIELLRDLPMAELDALAAVATRRALADGAVLFEQGDPAQTLYVVLRGGLVLRAGGNGPSVIVETVEPGEVVGWGAMRTAATTLSTARAVGSTTVVAIPVEPLIELASGGSSRSRELLQRLIGLAAAQLEASRQQLLRAGREGVITAG
ncbi:MAG TPA: cyclic nucleotide-binding domain-containing protein [Candidatus Limnocylindrales bacterium]|jgi:CRP-like cAMP-binding protein